VDGGAAANDLLMQFQADLLGVPVARPKVLETTRSARLTRRPDGRSLASRARKSPPLAARRRFEPSMSRDEAAAKMRAGARRSRVRAWGHEGNALTTAAACPAPRSAPAVGAMAIDHCLASLGSRQDLTGSVLPKPNTSIFSALAPATPGRRGPLRHASRRAAGCRSATEDVGMAVDVDVADVGEVLELGQDVAVDLGAHLRTRARPGVLEGLGPDQRPLERHLLGRTRRSARRLPRPADSHASGRTPKLADEGDSRSPPRSLLHDGICRSPARQRVDRQRQNRARAPCRSPRPRRRSRATRQSAWPLGERDQRLIRPLPLVWRAAGSLSRWLVAPARAGDAVGADFPGRPGEGTRRRSRRCAWAAECALP
jgi:hypothetical protein